MGIYTPKLNLFMTDMTGDGNDLFDFDRDLNQNFEKIENGIAILMYSLTAVYKKNDLVLNLNKTNKVELYQSLVNDNTNNPLSDSTKWQKVELGGGTLPIGMIYPVTCTSDYVPEGGLPCDGTEHTKAQFESFYTNFLTGGKLNTCTYDEYANDITNYGQCGKFALDAANEKFKVPYLKDGAYLAQALSDDELGKSYNESLPTHTHSYTIRSGSGSVAWTNARRALCCVSSVDSNATIANQFGSMSAPDNATYQSGAKVQGDNVRMRYFVQVANGEINESQMNWSEWASGLQAKANCSLSNLTTGGKSLASGLAMPSNRYINLALQASGTVYTAPANGYYQIAKDSTASGQYVLIGHQVDDGSTGINGVRLWSSANNQSLATMLPCKKGDKIVVVYTAGGNTDWFRFIYAEGN